MDFVAEEARVKNIFQTKQQDRDNLKRRIKRVDEDVVFADEKVGDLIRQEEGSG